MNPRGSAWKALLACAAGAFTSPSFALFAELMSAWALTPARRSIVGMVAVMDPASRAAHDAYHRLVRAGAWSLSACFQALGQVVVARLVGTGRVVCYLDDTLFHRPGRKVEGAASWRDAVRSTRARVVYARGLNLVVLGVRVRPPWGGMPLALPINIRLHRKHGPTMPELAREMMAELAAWLPEASFVLCADGAYATLAGDHLERTVVVSRLRRDAALYAAAPPRTGKRGRPRKKGARLPTPAELAQAAVDWIVEELDWRGRRVTKRLWSTDVLWYRVCPEALVRLVVVRDPAGPQPDDFFFFTTDRSLSPAAVVEIYAGRWAIECVFRDVKQGGRRAGAPILEAPGARARRRPVVLAVRRHLGLVPRGQRGAAALRDPAVVPGQGHPFLCRRPGRAAPDPVAGTHFPRFRGPRSHSRNRGGIGASPRRSCVEERRGDRRHDPGCESPLRTVAPCTAVTTGRSCRL